MSVSMFAASKCFSYAEYVFSDLPFEFPYAGDEFRGIAVASAFRRESLFPAHAVSAQSHDILYSHESQVIQLAFDFLPGRSSADDVRHDIYLVFGHDSPAYRHLADPVADEMSGIASILLLPELEFVAMTGHIDIFRGKFHKRTD